MNTAPLFACERRAEVLESLETFFKADESIAGAVLFGPAAEEKQDRYSGIYIQLAVSNSGDFPSIYRKWKDRLPELLAAMYILEQDVSSNHATLRLLLEGYLEIVLHFSRMKVLLAPHKPWRVLFDQTPQQDLLPTLQATYKDARLTTSGWSYRELMNTVWQYAVHAVIALERGEIWRAISNVDKLRARIITLAAMNYDVDVRDYSEVDQLPEMLLISLRHTIPTSTSDVAVRRALVNALTLLCNQAEILEAKLGSDELAVTIRAQLMPYINAYS